MNTRSVSMFLLSCTCCWACTPEIIVEPTPITIEASNCCCDDMGLLDMVDDRDMNVEQDIGPDPDLNRPDMTTEPDMPDEDMPADMMADCTFSEYGRQSTNDCTASLDKILIDPVVEWAWPFSGDMSEVTNVTMTPVVGDIDLDGTPDIVFVAYSLDGSQARIVAVSGDGTRELWDVEQVGPGNGPMYDVPTETGPRAQGVISPVSAFGVALGDIDSDGLPDVCFPGESDQAMVICLEGASGAFKWASAPGPAGQDYSWSYPAIANIDGAGDPEVILADRIYNGADGSLFARPATTSGIATINTRYPNGRLGTIPVPVDLDPDPDGDGVTDNHMELVAGKTIYYYDGTATLKVLFEDTYPDGFPAVADLDNDGRPEVVRTAHTPDAGSEVIVVDWDAVVGWHVDLDPVTSAPIKLPDAPGRTFGGPPTIADFDSALNAAGQNYPEIGIAGSEFYQVYTVSVNVVNAATYENDISLSYKWSPPLANRDASSSSTGSSVFDFEGDGKAEVIYADQNELFIIDGVDGTNRIIPGSNFQADKHCSGTVHEYPVIANVDGRDGDTEIVLASARVNPDLRPGADNSLYTVDCSNDTGWFGVRVIGSVNEDWVDSRGVWNQHAYSISNINDDLSVPAVPTPNWTVWNNFRTADAGDAPVRFRPDLIALPPQFCDCDEGKVLVGFGVGNASSQDAIGPFTVAIQDAVTGTVYRQETLQRLDSGDSELIGPFQITYSDWLNASLEIRVDNLAVPSSASGQVIECREDNNAITFGDWPCDL